MQKPWVSERATKFVMGGILLLILVAFFSGERRTEQTSGAMSEGSSKATGTATAQLASSSISEEVFLRETFGCKDWETWKSLGKVVAQGDKEAFAKILYPALAAGTCRRFKAGDRAYLSETAMLSASTCMRPKGEVGCYWVSIESTGKP